MLVSARLYAYLTLLKNQTMLGASENDVATFVLTQRLGEMLEQNYHETHKVPGSQLNQTETLPQIPIDAPFPMVYSLPQSSIPNCACSEGLGLDEVARTRAALRTRRIQH